MLRLHLLLPIAFLLLPTSRCNVDSFLGIAPQDEWYFKAAGAIKCRDGSGKFTREQLNDEFCDCPDGTDEPGTSACPEGRFYCRNVGHAPVIIFSSRVNDGICDCCDGSDEYNGKTKCSNTCWEAGKAARERLKKRIAIFEEGVTIRSHEVKKARDAFSKDEADLAKLKDEEKVLKGLVQKLQDHKEQIEKVEEQERIKREKEEQRTKELEKEKQKINELEQKEKEEQGSEEVQDIEGPVLETELSHQGEQKEIDESTSKDEHTSDGEGTLSDDNGVDEDKKASIPDEAAINPNGVEAAHEKNQDSENSEELSKEELGRLVASRWTGEKVDEKVDNVDDTAVKQSKEEGSVDLTETSEKEDYDGYNSESDDNDDNDKYDDSDFDDQTVDHGDSVDNDHDSEWEERDLSDPSSSGSQSWLGKIQQTVQHVLQAINLFKAPLNMSEAATIRKEYDDASSKLSKMQSRISSLTEKLKHDFGNEMEFYLFYNQCFESKENKYTYKVCPFKQASQVEGHSTTRLGSWDKFEETHRVMLFSKGDRCWNGPDRSLKVRLRCGLKNELTDVDEPSRCEYEAVLSTPLLCQDAKLKELKEKLQLLNSGQALPHDEL